MNAKYLFGALGLGIVALFLGSSSKGSGAGTGTGRCSPNPEIVRGRLTFGKAVPDVSIKSICRMITGHGDDDDVGLLYERNGALLRWVFIYRITTPIGYVTEVEFDHFLDPENHPEADLVDARFAPGQENRDVLVPVEWYPYASRVVGCVGDDAVSLYAFSNPPKRFPKCRGCP